jgi:hypothetical protein
MNYSNDESDRTLRRRNFIIMVYIFPLMVIISICAAIYFASQNQWLTGTDSRNAYLYSFCGGAIAYVLSKRKWLKMPDGSYNYIRNVARSQKISPREPAYFEEEYYVSNKVKGNTAFLGLTVAGIGIYLALETSSSILIPSLTILGGLMLSYLGVKGFRDHEPKLKLAKEGLWTEKLGFVDWKDIDRAQVVAEMVDRSLETVLEIYLKGSIFAESSQPDERLILTELEDQQFVEMALETMMSKRNNNSWSDSQNLSNV